MASSSTKISREEHRRAKDLDAARKAGNAPAEVDAVTGKEINPHIPEFMAKAPWYLDVGQGPSLVHQSDPKAKDEGPSLANRYERGRMSNSATKYRKGACANCGAMSHTARECLERPRKKGAKWTGRDIAPDEYILNNHQDENWDAKRDRWDGYDPAEHKGVIEKHALYEEARQKAREEQIDSTTDLKAVEKFAKTKQGKDKKKKENGEDDEFGSSDDSENEDELKYADAANVVGQKIDTKTRMTIRNLRIREDTAKYLMNLDPDSAFYDPKSRAMREAPDKSVKPEDAQYAGDNFYRASKDSTDAERLQLFAWQSEQRGGGVHVNSNPTAADLAYKEHLGKKEDFKEESASSMLSKYGGEEYMKKIPKELATGQDENYVEYSRTGQVVKGQERAKAKSKYDEDVYPGNHTSVWGSWFDIDERKWGFACCHSTIHGSYCVGAVGIESNGTNPAKRLKIDDT